MKNLLEVDGLKTVFRTEHGEIASVEEVSFQVKPGETLAIVGESGCGKSVTSLSILNLLGSNGYIKAGKITFDEQDLTKLSAGQLRKLRGKDISMIFQDPMSSLNPVLTIGNQMTETILQHERVGMKEAEARSIRLLTRVGIARADALMKQYPNSLSGGMRQRVMIAMALACKPKLLIADEPTTALDVTIQAQILELIKELKQEFQTSIVLITHDLGVVAEMADRVLVMYAGQVVEEADVYTLFETARHPYTQGLLSSIPHLDAPSDKLTSIPGYVPSIHQMPEGCRFQSRCALATEKCRSKNPPLFPVDGMHHVRCWLAEDELSLAAFSSHSLQ
ncbi:ABC transporter ATP-binding protein [Paenibacillus piri]|uniref:ABC transporter ATP-binding protein n=1 Tax=Paenibacillus piri TaxID=2547395 RepID=A0A4R5KEG8_9BACL|nr:ABC transporter ATP-binding protein [Paenibacillus piri]TDF93721.1 ABC transporter ATP-binding protein [Paenibacillus piri]